MATDYTALPNPNWHYWTTNASTVWIESVMSPNEYNALKLKEKLSNIEHSITKFLLSLKKKMADRNEVLKWEINKEKISEELSKFFSNLDLKVKEIKIFDNPKEFGDYFIEKVVDEELRKKIKEDRVCIDDILKTVKKYTNQNLISEFEKKWELIDTFLSRTLGIETFFGSDIGISIGSKDSAELFDILERVHEMFEENFLNFATLWEKFREKKDGSISDLFKEDVGETLRSIYVGFLRSWFGGSFSKIMQFLRRYLVCYKVWVKTQSENYERLTKLLEPIYNAFTNGAFLLNFVDDEAIVLTSPEIHLRDKRFHNEKGAAISWNGIGFYYLEGIRIPKEIWEKIVSKTLTGKEFLKIENLEIKSLAVRYIGYQKLLESLECKVLDREKVMIGTEFYDEEVIEVDLKDDDVPARFVKVRDFSTKREYLMRVDPRDKQTKTVKGALAWLAGVKEKEYTPEIET
jgi:hypothetical protein